jgi:uncharacterized protein
MSQTLSLYRLQQVDNQIERLQTRLKVIQSELDDDTELRRLKERVETAITRCQSAELALKQADLTAQNQVIKIQQTHSSLYGDKSHSPKELQDLQNDLASLKRHLVTLEDNQIDAMQESETAEADQQIAHNDYRAALDNRAVLGKNLQLEMGVVRNDLDRFFVERNAVAGAIPEIDIGLYEQLRNERRGFAVAVITDNSCGACGSTLSPAQMQTARSSGKTLLCPSCGRILYGS